MTLLKRWRKRLRPLVRKSEVEGELNEELAFHLEMETQKHIRAGLAPEEAQRRARLAFGGVDSHKEQVRDARFFGWLDNLIADVRFTLRQYRRRPGTTLTIVLVLALGIGVNCALFAVSYSMLTQPAAGIDPDEALVRIRVPVDLDELDAYAGRENLFESVAAYRNDEVVFDMGEPSLAPFSAVAFAVTPSYFPLLGVRPVVGSPLPLGEDRAGPDVIATVISHDLWVRYYGESPGVVGRRIRIDGHPATIVGVAPRGFMGVDQRSSAPALWLTLSALGTLSSERASGHLSLIGRLGEGLEWARAEAEVEAIFSHLRNISPGQGPTADIAPLLAHNQHSYSDQQAIQLIGLASTLGMLILLITCANTSGLLLGIAINRGHELAIRLSVGASRMRIIRQLLTESVILSLLAAGLGAFLAWRMVLLIGDSVRGVHIVANWSFVVFAVLLALATGILFGLSPALHATRHGLGAVLRSGSATMSGVRNRLQNSITVSQIALTQPLLLFVVLFLHVAFVQLRDSAGQEVHEEIAVLQVPLASLGPAEETLATARSIKDRMEALPGVRAVTFGAGATGVARVPRLARTDDGIADSVEIREQWVTPDFFEVFEIPLLAGRYFDESDTDGENSPILVGDDLARQIWASADPIGRSLQIRGQRRTIVGVVDESAARSSETPNDIAIFTPAPTSYWGRLLIRTAGPAEPRLAFLQQELRAAFPDAPIGSASTFAIDERESLRAAARMAAYFGGGGILALLLAAVGLTALISFAVARRTKEIGIRSALGATPLGLMSVFIRSGLRLGLLGVAIGLPISLFFGKSALPDAWDGQLPLSLPVAVAIVAGSVLAVTLFATWLPARRATRLDPLRALKVE